MRYLLIGKSGKRRDYFLKACQEMNLPLLFFDIESKELAQRLLPGDVVKIDPIAGGSARLAELNESIQAYGRILHSLAKRSDVHFLNAPAAIFQTLDKKLCKKRLSDERIPATPMLDFAGTHFEELTEFMCAERLSQIFIKPNFGSGAAGILALRRHPRTGRLIAYTTIAEQNGEYVNTKRLHMLTDHAAAARMADFLLQRDPIIERWIPKDSIGGHSYDLRVVYQFGQIAMIQVRGARRGAVTNLHLNNFPIEAAALKLSGEELQRIEQLCERAIALFPALRSVGFDILIEKNTRKPYIIEMNAQGDLMYRDIFGENRIYKEQVKRMEKQWQEK